jgi:F-type H+-transporting ATPase subunit epsilon
MHIHIAKINGVLWSGDADVITVPASEGEVTILAGHIPLVSNLRKGVLTVKQGGTEVFSHEVEQGIIEVNAKSVTVLL